MQLESLKIFCDVVRQRSFSQAAQTSGITQSAVSQIVSQLEKRMNVQLIDRSTRPLQLTPLGLTYYEGCKILLEQYGELEARIRNAQLEISGTVTVAASATAAVPTHLNKDYSWAIKDPSNNPLKTKADFKFTGGSDKKPLNATVTLVPGTLKGAYCSASSCIPFTATCTATACTIN